MYSKDRKERKVSIEDMASDVLLVVATASSILPLILRVVVQIYLRDKSEDPTGISSSLFIRRGLFLVYVVIRLI